MSAAPSGAEGSRTTLSGWGRYPRCSCRVRRPERYADLYAGETELIHRGRGRSYGDAAVNREGTVVMTERLNRVLAFDASAGRLRTEAGASLAELLAVIVPHGWFLPVTPGTAFASIGGCVAADVHGKNHHREGSIGNHVEEIELRTAAGLLTCSAARDGDAFWATVGGMGLTGAVGTVALRLKKIETASIAVEHRVAPDLEATFAALSDDFDDEYTVAWIDCLAAGKRMGRGIVMRGHHAGLDELPSASRRDPLRMPEEKARRLPATIPQFALNPFTVRLFNTLYYTLQGRKRRPFVSAFPPFFYPLDAIANWNLVYGASGFVQYQCVLPAANAYEGMRRLLGRISSSGKASFLAVLKRLGDANPGMLSFPLPGYTLALDLPLRSRRAGASR